MDLCVEKSKSCVRSSKVKQVITYVHARNNYLHNSFVLEQHMSLCIQ